MSVLLVDLLRKDFQRPMGAWAKLSLTCSVLSVGALELWEADFSAHDDMAKIADALSIPTLYLLLASIVFGIVAITRKGTSKSIPAIVLLVVYFLVPGYVIISFVELPLLTAVKVMEIGPYSYLILGLVASVAVAALYSHNHGEHPLASLVRWAQQEWQAPLNRASTISLIVALGAACTLRLLPIMQANLILHLPQISDLLQYTVLAFVLRAALYIVLTLISVAALIISVHPLWRRGENRILPLIALLALGFLLPGPLFVGLYVLLLGLIWIFWNLGFAFRPP